MDGTQAGIAATVAEIEAAFGGHWGAWLSDTGRWWAARRHRLTVSQQRTGCVPFLHAPSAGELAMRISMQEAHAATAAPTPDATGHHALSNYPGSMLSAAQQIHHHPACCHNARCAGSHNNDSGTVTP